MWLQRVISNIQERLAEGDDDTASAEDLLRCEIEHRRRRTVRNLRTRLEELDRRLTDLQQSA